MGKARIYFDGNPVDFEGTPDEVAKFLRLMSRDKQRLGATGEAEAKARQEMMISERLEVESAKQHLPSVDDVKKYILSRPEYRHTTFEIQHKFFRRTFKARGITEGIFHDFLHIAQEARVQILKEKGGRFDNVLEMGRHKVWRWRKE